MGPTAGNNLGPQGNLNEKVTSVSGAFFNGRSFEIDWFYVQTVDFACRHFGFPAASSFNVTEVARSCVYALPHLENPGVYS